ncbi:MAG: DNA recombination protein RmuC [bacterium]|nr:DNA recombination protein RmuC [Acidimicrobiia bacterium]MCY4649111.1 DNA recombination protein RmuC [bacterium]
MEFFIIIALSVVASLLAWDIAARRSSRRDTQIQRQSEDTVQAVLDLLGRDRQERQLESQALTEKAAIAAAAEAARMAKAELETQSRSSAEMIAQQQRTFSRTAEQIGAQIAGIQRDLTSRQGSWSEQFGQVSETLAKLGGTTETLTNMLNSSGQKGSWGERVAEDILRAVGMKEGVSYEVRKRLPGGQIPDFAFYLPRGQLLCMDSKLPFDSYRAYQEAPESKKDQFRREFLKAVRGHVRSLATKSYGDAGLVLMFIPLESIYSLIWEGDHELLDYAFDRGVMLCGPSNLFAILTLVREANVAFALEKTGDQVLDVLNQMKREWMETQKAIGVLQGHINKANNKAGEITGKHYQAMDKVFDRIDEVRSERGMTPTDQALPGESPPLLRVS